ncbi:MAG: Sapep family Mn(2+)-dependent dipeptidase [Oscillospiraceae bacterium]
MNEIKDYIYSHRDELLGVLSELVAIPSVKGEPAEGAPFGKEPRRALDKMLDICGGMGFTTHCCENVVGTAELSAGEETALGILCHLDVVPAEPKNWHSDPFRMTEKDGVLFGRGVIDDKGPAAAALFAMKCVKDLGLPLKKGVKLVFGTDEENGSEDLEIFLSREKLPPMVFTPDGSFPIINIEKGMMRSRFEGAVNGQGSVVSLCGGSIPNAVPDRAEALLEGIALCDVTAAISSDKSGAVFAAENENGCVKITCKGRSAHASTPESGINAVTALIGLVNSLFAGGKLPVHDGVQSGILVGLAKVFPFGETDGASVGLKCSDEKSGALTCVFSIFSMDRNGCRGTVDVRFPTCVDLAFVESTERTALSTAGCEFAGFMGDEPHCVDEDSEFIRKLLRVYERVEGEKGRCIAIGGGTYVHNIKGGVAFGAERGDTDYHMHGADEFVTVDELLRDAVLFAEAIAEICG